jgi:hypothetical protein
MMSSPYLCRGCKTFFSCYCPWNVPARIEQFIARKADTSLLADPTITQFHAHYYGGGIFTSTNTTTAFRNKVIGKLSARNDIFLPPPPPLHLSRFVVVL